MDKSFIIKCYSKLGINSQTELYDYAISHDKVTINFVDYNLNNSNEAMEFMARFLEAFGFEVKRLFLESESHRHWFVVFNIGFKWFYYETCLENEKGMYSFKNFNNLLAFAISKIVKSLEYNESIKDDILDNYTLREIDALNEVDLDDNIDISRKGKELLFRKKLTNINERTDLFSKTRKNDIRRRVDGPSLLFLIFGFIVTLALGVFLVWLLAMHYSGKL